jgi:integrase
LLGPKDERISREARRPIGEHIAEFITSLESKGNAPKHVRSTRTYVERIVTLAGIARVADLAASAVAHPVAVPKSEGLSARAVNAYLTAAKSFSRWLYRDGRTRDYSLFTLATMNEQADRRRIRRALGPEEAVRVIQAAEAGLNAGGLTGPERTMLYALALGTGFRADEPATLTPERFALDADPPTATVLACYAKNGREAIQPLPSMLADRLRPWLGAKAPGRPVFDGMTERTAEMLRVDLEAAGVPCWAFSPSHLVGYRRRPSLGQPTSWFSLAGSFSGAGNSRRPGRLASRLRWRGLQFCGFQTRAWDGF